MFTAPTAFRAIKREDPCGALIRNYDFSDFKPLFLAGERCDPDTLHWAEDRLRVRVIDHWWQTETGWPICANCLGIEHLPVKPGSLVPRRFNQFAQAVLIERFAGVVLWQNTLER